MIDETSLTRAALRVIAELNLPCEVAAVLAVPQHAEWCIKFTPCYGYLCARFRDENGAEVSTEEIAETIKSHLIYRDEFRAQPSER